MQLKIEMNLTEVAPLRIAERERARSNSHRRHSKVSYREIEMLKVVLHLISRVN